MNHILKNIIAIVLVSACSTAVAQAATTPTTHQYLTTEQYVQQAKTRIIQRWSTELNQSISATNTYYLALDKAIATAPQSAYQKDGKKYSGIDYLCSNTAKLLPSVIDRSNYGIARDDICKNHFSAAFANIF